jgi:predicted phage-related endonuclease
MDHEIMEIDLKQLKKELKELYEKLMAALEILEFELETKDDYVE